MRCAETAGNWNVLKPDCLLFGKDRLSAQDGTGPGGTSAGRRLGGASHTRQQHAGHWKVRRVIGTMDSHGGYSGQRTLFGGALACRSMADWPVANLEGLRLRRVWVR
mgnify:CR=1 FL=1